MNETIIMILLAVLAGSQFVTMLTNLHAQWIHRIQQRNIAAMRDTSDRNYAEDQEYRKRETEALEIMRDEMSGHIAWLTEFKDKIQWKE